MSKTDQRFILERNVAISEQKTIDQWILQQEGGTWFHTTDAFRTVWLAEPLTHVVREREHGNLVAAFSYILTRRGGIFYPRRHSLLYFSSPVFGSLSDDDEQVVADLIRNQFDFVNWYFGWRAKPWKLSAGMPQTGLLLNISGELDSIFRSMSDLARRQMKKQLSGSMEWISPAMLSVEELSLMDISYGSHGKVAPVSADKLSEILSRINPDCLALRYQKDGITLAWRLWLADKRGWMTDWLSAIDKNRAEPQTGYHLVAESIRKAKEMGLQSLDLGGANTPGITDFKMKFKPEKRYGYSIIRAKSWYGQVLLNLNELKRRVTQKR